MAKRKKLTQKEKNLRAKIRKEIRAQIKADRDKSFSSTSLEQRRTFIGYIHSGKSIGESGVLAGISRDAAFEVLRRCTKTVKHSYIVPTDDVK